MFDWLRRHKKKVSVPKKREPKSRAIPQKAIPEAAETGKLIQAGRLLLQQKVVTDKGTDRLYVQPLKLEVPNMVTIGGKLDLILEELEKKPDKEWFQTDYIETLKNVLTLTSEVNIPEHPSTPQEANMAKAIDLINKEVSSALILETLKVKGPLNVTDLSKQTGVSRVTIWRDLKKLSKEGKVKIKREGKFKIASLK